MCGLKAAVRSGATPVEVATEEDVEDALVFAVAVVELEGNDWRLVAEPFLLTKMESRKDLA